jgi:hypothetical protein
VVLVVLNFAQHIEEENTHILVQVLVVEEQLRQKGEVLAIDGILVAVDLEHSHRVLLIAVDLITGRMKKRAALGVPLELHFQREEAEAEIADVEAIEVVVVDGVGAEVPS